jgi:hypothetical protein
VTELIDLHRLPQECPDWPISPWSTGNLIRQGKLGCVRVGRRMFVTRQILAEFIERSYVPPRESR